MKRIRPNWTRDDGHLLVERLVILPGCVYLLAALVFHLWPFSLIPQ